MKMIIEDTTCRVLLNVCMNMPSERISTHYACYTLSNIAKKKLSLFNYKSFCKHLEHDFIASSLVHRKGGLTAKVYIQLHCITVDRSRDLLVRNLSCT